MTFNKKLLNIISDIKNIKGEKMAEYELLTTVADSESESNTERCDYYCTNPMTSPENLQIFSWLDDYGWI